MSYEFGVAAPSLYANIFAPVAYPAAVTLAPLAQDTIPVPDRFLDRVVTLGTLATAVEQLPDWWTPSSAFGNQITGHSAQLLEEPVDALLVLQSELQNPSAAPRDAAAMRTEAKSYLTELWADLLHKLGDPQNCR